MQRAIELLRPIYDAQWQHILQSRVLAMDDKFAGRKFGQLQLAPKGRAPGKGRANPIKAGYKKKGQMQATWYWPNHGEDDELCFTWSTSQGSVHTEQQLGDFAGVPLSDGYAAYDHYAKNKPQITRRPELRRTAGAEPARGGEVEFGMQAHIEMMRFNPGQRVSFEHGGGRLFGTLVKYNRKTVTAVTDDGQRWNIPPHLLSAVKDAGAAQPQQPVGKNKKRLR